MRVRPCLTLYATLPVPCELAALSVLMCLDLAAAARPGWLCRLQREAQCTWDAGACQPHTLGFLHSSWSSPLRTEASLLQ